MAELPKAESQGRGRGQGSLPETCFCPTLPQCLSLLQEQAPHDVSKGDVAAAPPLLGEPLKKMVSHPLPLMLTHLVLLLLQEQQAGAGARHRHLGRRPTMLEGLFSGLDPAAGLSPSRMDAKIRLLVEAPAAVEDALASLLDHHDPVVQVGASSRNLEILPKRNPSACQGTGEAQSAPLGTNHKRSMAAQTTHPQKACANLVCHQTAYGQA